MSVIDDVRPTTVTAVEVAAPTQEEIGEAELADLIAEVEAVRRELAEVRALVRAERLRSAA